MTNMALIRQNPERPRCTVRKMFPPWPITYRKYWDEHGYAYPTHMWACVYRGEIVDVFIAKTEAQIAAGKFDPDRTKGAK